MQRQVTVWRKSSYSGVEHNCVEVGAEGAGAVRVGAWLKSSHSGANGDCVEVGHADPSVASVAFVRDSKRPAGPNLRFTAESWAAFLARRPSDAT
ncbi:DUF397 domain-containing protein [Streptomycetaceae bacterium NBC_01309]